MKIPQDFIDDLLSRVDLLDIVSPRITLKKAGKAKYSGLCPFHLEKSPSFWVNQTKQFYYCFGCKASGNAIRFLMEYDKLSFLESIEALAGKAGIALPETKHKEKKINIGILDNCTRFFQEELEKSDLAKAYLIGRGLNTEIIQRFRLGYAPQGWSYLKNKIGQSREKEENLLETGMLIQKEDKSCYDRFRDRIMFPIRNRRSDIIAFGGRTVQSTLPKYLNSPDTPFFHKSRELYGLFEVLEANQRLENMIIVEGYLDVITLHQFGLTQAVATLGTAISQQQIQTLIRFTENLFFCFDGDQAGRTAAWRALEVALPLMHAGINIKFLFLPSQEDPDSYIRKMGSSAFREQIETAIPLSEFFLQKLSDRTEIESLAGKTRFVHLADKYLQSVPKGIFHELMLGQVANIIGLSKEKLHEILQPDIKAHIKEKRANSINIRTISAPIRLAISLLIQFPKLLEVVKIPEKFAEINQEGMPILLKLIQIIQKNPEQTTGSLLEYFYEDHEKLLLGDLGAKDVALPQEMWQTELQGVFTLIMNNDVENQIQGLLKKGKEQELTENEKKVLQNLLILQKQL